MPSIFDEASKATEDMFEENENSGAEENVMNEEVPEEETEEQREIDNPSVSQADSSLYTREPREVEEENIPEQGPQDLTPEEATLAEATQTAEVAAEVAARKDSELQAMRQQMEAMQRQNDSMYATIEELSKKNEENLIEDILEPPVLDVSALAFADENTIKQAQAEYAKAMADYNRKAFMKEFAPVIEQANKAKLAEEKNEVISILSQIPELKGIDSMIPQLDRIIENNKALSSENVPIDEKYITAFAIATGVNSMNTPPVEAKEPTVDELMALYNSNPEFQEMVERQRIDQVKNSQQVPPMSASSGAVNAALDIKEEPKGWDDASERTRKMFGLG